jgi:CcmD family protein
MNDEGTATQTVSPDEFRPTEGGADTVDANVLFVAAYLVFWFLIAGFVWLTWRKQRELDARLARLEKTGASSGSDS